jgi:hypothetical protein
MEDTFLRCVYEIITLEPQKPVRLDDVATLLRISDQEADAVAQQLQCSRLIYRFPERRVGSGVELVITRDGALRAMDLVRAERLREASAEGFTGRSSDRSHRMGGPYA